MSICQGRGGREGKVDCGLPAINSAVFGFLTAKKLASFSSALWPRNSFTAGDGNPKVLAAVKSGAFKLKLQAKQTAAGRDCRLGMGLGYGDWTGTVGQMKSEPYGNAKTVPKHKFAACLHW